MIDFRADLHCHSTCSDGSDTPLELIKRASASELNALSITDHDTIEAYSLIDQTVLDQYNLKLLSGVEISTIFKGISIHVLAYSFNIQNQQILSLCQSQKLRRFERMKEMIHLLSLQGISIDANEILMMDRSLGRPHLAQAIIRQGYAETMQDAFNLYLGDGKSCFVPSNNIPTQDALELVRKAGAVSILAHPHLIKQQHLIKDLLNLQFDGLEGYYAQFAPSQIESWIKIAEYKRWIITGGSDYHGTVKSNNFLGSSWVDQVTFDFLYDRYNNNNE